jgi:Transcriptional activator of glycolytic enzymes
VEQLERDWQSRWRPAAAQRTAWSRCKTVVDEVQRLVAAGLAPAAAVAELEAQRGSSTLRGLIDALVEERRQPSRRRRTSRHYSKGPTVAA